MADQNMAAEETLLDVRVAEASKLYKFYLNQEKLILGTLSVSLFLLVWELVGNVFQLINPMFMSAPSLIWKAAVQLFGSGEIWNDLSVSGIEFGWGYFLSIFVGVPFGIAIGWYKKFAYICDPIRQRDERNAAGCAFASDHYLVGHRHSFQDRNYFSRRGIPLDHQYARRCEDHACQSPQRREKLRCFGMAVI